MGLEGWGKQSTSGLPRLAQIQKNQKRKATELSACFVDVAAKEHSIRIYLGQVT
jgi:hypothetical protein